GLAGSIPTARRTCARSPGVSRSLRMAATRSAAPSRTSSRVACGGLMGFPLLGVGAVFVLPAVEHEHPRLFDGLDVAGVAGVGVGGLPVGRQSQADEVVAGVGRWLRGAP